jgi:Uncharacterized membrane protein, putative virulence factor
MRRRVPRPRLTPGVRLLVRLGLPVNLSSRMSELNLGIETTDTSFFVGSVASVNYPNCFDLQPFASWGLRSDVVRLAREFCRVRARATKTSSVRVP